MLLSEPEITIDLLEDSRTDTDSVFVVYTNETGGGLFDRYTFSINDQHSTTVVKEKDDERMVKFESLVAGTLYTVTARSESGDVRSRWITTQVLTGEKKQPEKVICRLPDRYHTFLCACN